MSQEESKREVMLRSIVRDALETSVNRVPTNGPHARYYTEPLADQQWNRRHHLIDVSISTHGNLGLDIFELSSSDPCSRVDLSYNEVDELLAALLLCKLQYAEDAEEQREAAASRDGEGDFLELDDNNPF